MLFANSKPSIQWFGHLGIRIGCSMAIVCIVNLALGDEAPPASPPNFAKPTAETRFIKFEKASVHCGPAKDHYITSELPRGSSVEVFHQTKDGWCGIRPPNGSHDWLAADQTYLLPGGKQAEVVGNTAPAWIGAESNLKNQRFRWQIELQPTQKVDVIGEIAQAVDSDKIRLWYKILPPPGEFRWIRSEALSVAPPKSRSTTVTVANAKEAATNSEEVAQQAAYNSTQRNKAGSSSVLVRHAVANQDSPIPPISPMPTSGESVEPIPMINYSTEHTSNEHTSNGQVIEREPIAGQFIEGEGIVIGSTPGEWHGDEGYVEDEGYVHGNSMADGSIVDGDEWIVEGDAQPCATCNRVGCTTCGPSHQTDSFQQWDATVATGNPRLRFRPISRILGLFGLSVVEGERIEDPRVAACPFGCGCARCMQGTADLHPRSSGRLNHLPRPIRRLPVHGPSNWLGMKDSLEGSLGQSYLASLPSPSTNSSNTPSTGNWHGIAPARLGSELGSVSAGIGSNSNNKTLLGNDRPAVVAASANGDELHFTTPEIQQAMIDLTRVVSNSMDRWDLREHAARAQQWIEQAVDPIARGEARLLLERIESFEILRRRSQLATDVAYATTPSTAFTSNNSVPASLAGFQRPADSLTTSPSSGEPFPASPAAVQRNADGTPASDASGWLVAVHSAEYGQPEFALTDDNGGLIAYVQPLPGMNLSRYLKQPVGIYGVKGYLPNLSARQIVAERIVRLR